MKGRNKKEEKKRNHLSKYKLMEGRCKSVDGKKEGKGIIAKKENREKQEDCFILFIVRQWSSKCFLLVMEGRKKARMKRKRRFHQSP